MVFAEELVKQFKKLLLIPVLSRIGYSKGGGWEKYLYDVIIHIIALRRAVPALAEPLP